MNLATSGSGFDLERSKLVCSKDSKWQKKCQIFQNKFIVAENYSHMGRVSWGDLSFGTLTVSVALPSKVKLENLKKNHHTN